MGPQVGVEPHLRDVKVRLAGLATSSKWLLGEKGSSAPKADGDLGSVLLFDSSRCDATSTLSRPE